MVAGPSDQGARGKSYLNSQVRYGLEIFFLSLSREMGRGFINCLWMEAPCKPQCCKKRRAETPESA